MYICTFQKESSRGRHREKEDIKITKERTPESEEENVEWETNRDGEFQKNCLYSEFIDYSFCRLFVGFKTLFNGVLPVGLELFHCFCLFEL